MHGFVYRYLSCAVLLGLAAPGWAQFGGPAKVAVAKVEMRPLPASTTLVGTVEPVTHSLVGSEVAGLVERMPVRQGDFVRAGELICKLKDDTISLRLEEARERLKGLEATQRKWVFEQQRIERLYGSQDAAEKEVYDAKAAHDLARYAASEQRATIARLESELAKTEIKAPFSGFIVSRHTEVGQWMVQGGDVVEIADLSTVLVRVDLPERCLPYVHAGDRAVVRVEALEQSFEGRVRHVMLQADATARTFPVEIAVPNPGLVEVDGQMIPQRVAHPQAAGGQPAGSGHSGQAAGDQAPAADPAGLRATLLAGGMFARATLQAGPSAMTPTVPKDAVVMRGGVEFVCMVSPGREQGSLMAIPVPVTTGVDVGDWIAVTSGNLAPGMQVVVKGNELILFPSPIQIVQPLGAVADADPAEPAAAPGSNSKSGS